jgi:hypothetical protein
MRVPVPAAEVRSISNTQRGGDISAVQTQTRGAIVGMGYHEYLKVFEDTGTCERLGQILYLLNPSEYRLRRDIVAALPTHPKKYLAHRDFNTIHFFGMDTTIDPHRDVKDVGFVFQLMMGQYEGGETCINDLGIRIRHRAGSVFAFHPECMVHYARSHVGNRYFHTMHVQDTAIHSYERHRDVWRVLGPDWQVDPDHDTNIQHAARVLSAHMDRDPRPEPTTNDEGDGSLGD